MSRTLLAALLAVALLLGPATAAAPTADAQTEAAEHYLAPGGSDSHPGTEARPWATFDHALRQLAPGDTLYVRGGTYRELVSTTPYTPGRAGAPITVRAYPGEQPVLRGRLAIRDAHHWVFHGIDVTADPDVHQPEEPLVKIMGGTGWVWRNAEVSGARAFAAVYVGVTHQGSAPAHWRVEGNCIHSTRTVHPPYQDHNIYVQNGRSSGPGTIERNVVFGAPNGNNIKVGGSGTSTSAGNVTIRYNTLHSATQNVLVARDTPDVVIERNIVGPRTVARHDYPNLRGYGATGAGVVARDNVGYGAAQFIRNTPENDTTEVAHGIADGGNNRFPVDPGFSHGGCGGLVPSAPHALAYGHRAGVERVAGSGRVETSVALSQAAFAAVGSADTVLLARADAYPDALAGAPLAAQLDAPLLLTGRDRLHPAAAAEIRRLAPRRAVVLGGEAAVSRRVVSDVRGLGVGDVRRVAGSDRFDTAGQIAREVAGPGTHAYVVEGSNPDPARGWPDAVSVSALAAHTGRPILLTGRDRLPGGTAAAIEDLGVSAATVIGGPAAVSARVAGQIADLGADVDRIAGSDRYETSRLVAVATANAGADPDRLWAATGLNWPDALAAGPAAAAGGGVLLLVHGTNVAASPAARAWARSHGGDRFGLVGGRAAISLAVEDVLAREAGPR